MACQLPADCLNEILEYLEEDKITLHSCLLVNRFWCEISVRILWRNVWSLQYSVHDYNPYRTHVPSSIISTLIACLPKKSKDLLTKSRISIASPTWKPPLFNYVSFCKVLSVNGIERMIHHVLETSQASNNNISLLSQEILEMYMNQVSSLKSLEYYSRPLNNSVSLFKEKSCLKDLTELSCSSDVRSGFFQQISQTCHNIQSLTINFGYTVSKDVKDLISSQNNLKSLTLQNYEDRCGLDFAIFSLSKFSSTLTKLKIKNSYMSLLFVNDFTNLQELILSF